MADEEIAGYLIRREVEDEDEFWHPETSWVSDPSDAMLYEAVTAATEAAEALSEGGVFEITVEEVLYDDEEEDEGEE